MAAGRAALSDAESIRAAARAAAISLPEARGAAAGSFLPFFGPEPVVELLPHFFIPKRAEESVGDDVLHELAVAGKIVYAQVRWLDTVADEPESHAGLLLSHPLNEATTSLVCSKFATALGDTWTTPFLSNLTQLYAQYAASLAIDCGSTNFPARPLDLDRYIDHAVARAVPIRAPLDAVLLLVGASEGEIGRAQSCFKYWAAGLQLYDDAIDLEEDYKEDRLSWVVRETLRAFPPATSSEAPDPNLFYETALAGGSLAQNLAAAETLFSRAIALAEPEFPGCVGYLNLMLHKTRELNGDLEVLLDSAIERQSAAREDDGVKLSQ